MKYAVIFCVGLLGLVGILSTACGSNECDFLERCSGDVREVCGGPDQMVNRSIDSYPCEGATPTCVEIDDRYARCVASPVTECSDEDFEAYCDGSLAYRCGGVTFTQPVSFPHRYLVAQDCALEDGRVCELVHNEDVGREVAQCVESRDTQ